MKTKQTLVLIIAMAFMTMGCHNKKKEIFEGFFSYEISWKIENLSDTEVKILNYKGVKNNHHAGYFIEEIFVPAVINNKKVVEINNSCLIEIETPYNEVNYTKSIYLLRLTNDIFKKFHDINTNNFVLFKKVTIPKHLNNEQIINFALNNGFSKTEIDNIIIYEK